MNYPGSQQKPAVLPSVFLVAISTLLSCGPLTKVRRYFQTPPLKKRHTALTGPDSPTIRKSGRQIQSDSPKKQSTVARSPKMRSRRYSRSQSPSLWCKLINQLQHPLQGRFHRFRSRHCDESQIDPMFLRFTNVGANIRAKELFDFLLLLKPFSSWHQSRFKLQH